MKVVGEYEEITELGARRETAPFQRRRPSGGDVKVGVRIKPPKEYSSYAVSKWVAGLWLFMTNGVQDVWSPLEDPEEKWGAAEKTVLTGFSTREERQTGEETILVLRGMSHRNCEVELCSSFLMSSFLYLSYLPSMFHQTSSREKWRKRKTWRSPFHPEKKVRLVLTKKVNEVINIYNSSIV